MEVLNKSGRSETVVVETLSMDIRIHTKEELKYIVAGLDSLQDTYHNNVNEEHVERLRNEFAELLRQWK